MNEQMKQSGKGGQVTWTPGKGVMGTKQIPQLKCNQENVFYERIKKRSLNPLTQDECPSPFRALREGIHLRAPIAYCRADEGRWKSLRASGGCEVNGNNDQTMRCCLKGRRGRMRQRGLRCQVRILCIAISGLFSYLKLNPLGTSFQDN